MRTVTRRHCPILLRHHSIQAALVFALLGSRALCGVSWGESTRVSVNSSHPTYDLDSFRHELSRLQTRLAQKSSTTGAAALRDSLPESWTVSAAGHTYSISTEPVREQLRTGSPEEARAWLQHLQQEVEGAEGPSPNFQNARSELDRILAAREFSVLRAKPGAFERLRDRITLWLDRLLTRMFRGMARHPGAATVLFWLIVLGAVAFVAFLAFRFLSSRDRMASLPPGSPVGVQQSWQEWLRAAREAGGRRDYREAVHSAYWAGIARLEDLGALSRDRARTPREYLRMVAEVKAEEDGAPQNRKEKLRALTIQMERTWYANVGAGPEDFREALRRLEELGCPLA